MRCAACERGDRYLRSMAGRGGIGRRTRGTTITAGRFCVPLACSGIVANLCFLSNGAIVGFDRLRDRLTARVHGNDESGQHACSCRERNPSLIMTTSCEMFLRNV